MAGITYKSNLLELWMHQVKEHPNKEFLLFEGANKSRRSFSYTEFYNYILQSAKVLLDLGIKKGDLIVSQLHACPEFISLLFASSFIGAIYVPINEQAEESEIEYKLIKTKAKLAIVESPCAEVYQKLAQKHKLLEHGVLIARLDDTNKSSDNFTHLINENALITHENFDAYDELSPSEEVVEIIFTSGTTSDPKGVMLTQANLIYSGVYGAWQVSLSDSDRFFTNMPPCHSNFQLAALMPVLYVGATIILFEKYSASRFIEQIKETKSTIAQAVSMIVRTLLLQPARDGEQDHSLRRVLYFLPISVEEKEEFESRYNTKIQNTYGSTESIGWVLTDPPSGEQRFPSVGRAGIGYEVKIFDDHDHELQAGEIGEIVVKGIPGISLMKGYFEDERATSRALINDWLYTGDKGYMDEDGWFYFVDRKSNMIKRQGENISSLELEEFFESHPKVETAAVIGVKDPIRDMAIKLFVVPKAGMSITEEELFDYAHGQIAAFKIPSFIEIRDSLPMTVSLKVEKKLLK